LGAREFVESSRELLELPHTGSFEPLVDVVDIESSDFHCGAVSMRVRHASAGLSLGVTHTHIASMPAAVRDNPALSRFELDANGVTAVSYYTLAGVVMTFTHTEVPPQARGGGIASRLIAGALEAARARGLKIVVRCPFVGAYLGKHPEFNDLLA
jgi:predicted GNAT family acetyltransferase